MVLSGMARTVASLQTLWKRLRDFQTVQLEFAGGVFGDTDEDDSVAKEIPLREWFTEAERDGVTDACAYRRILVSGSALAKEAILKAEIRAGRSVDKLVIGQGAHSHDGGRTWHDHK
jgi:hypothetical protein